MISLNDTKGKAVKLKCGRETCQIEKLEILE
jgi:hypothetical protein